MHSLKTISSESMTQKTLASTPLDTLFTQGFSKSHCLFNFYHPLNPIFEKIIMSNDLHMSFESLPGLLKVVRNRQKIKVCTKRHSKVDVRDSGLQQAAPEMVCFSGCQVTLLALVKLVLKLPQRLEVCDL